MPQLQTIVWGTIYIVNIFYLDMLLTKYNKNIHKTKQIPFDNSHSLYNNVWRDMWLHLGNQYMEICTLNGISNHCLNKTVGQLQIDQMKLWINRMKSTMRGNQTVIFFLQYGGNEVNMWCIFLGEYVWQSRFLGEYVALCLRKAILLAHSQVAHNFCSLCSQFPLCSQMNSLYI